MAQIFNFLKNKESKSNTKVILIFGFVFAFFIFFLPIISATEFAYNYLPQEVDDFLDLDDTPNSFATGATKCVKVNAGETGLEFGTCSPGGGGDFNTVEYNPAFLNNITEFTPAFNSTFNGTYDDFINSANNTYVPYNGATSNVNLGVQNISTNDTLKIADVWITNSSGTKVNGTILVAELVGPTGVRAPHFILQAGGGDQGSVMVRSMIIANENTDILNSADATDCGVWATEFGVRRRVDCNTTTSGADLFIGDDAQVGGDISISEMDGNGTYYSLNDFFKLYTSPGRITGGDLTNPSGSDVVVQAGTGMIRIADDDISSVKFVDWVESIPIAVPLNSIMYYGFGYNATMEIQVVNYSDESLFDLDTQVPLGSAINQGGEIYMLNNPWWTSDGLTNVIERFEAQGHLVRDAEVGGLILGSTGTRNPTMTSGKIWSRLTEHDISAFDASIGDTFDYYYRDGAGGWSEYSGQTQWNVTSYDDGSGTPTAYINNRYGVIWVWINVGNGKIALTYPQVEHITSAQAEAEGIPNTFPAMWYKGGIIIGRIIVQEGVDAPVQIQSSFAQTFSAVQAADHGNLGGLTDDDHAQYVLASGNRNITLLNVTNNIVTQNVTSTGFSFFNFIGSLINRVTKIWAKDINTNNLTVTGTSILNDTQMMGNLTMNVSNIVFRHSNITYTSNDTCAILIVGGTERYTCMGD